MFVVVGIVVALVAVGLVLMFYHGVGRSSSVMSSVALYGAVGSSCMSHTFYAVYIVNVSEGSTVSVSRFIVESNGRSVLFLKTSIPEGSFSVLLERSGDMYRICTIVKTVSMSSPVASLSIVNASGSPLQVLFDKAGLVGIYNAITVALYKGHRVSSCMFKASYEGYNVTLVLLCRGGLYLPKLVKIVGKNGITVMKLVQFSEMYNPLDFERAFKLCGR